MEFQYPFLLILIPLILTILLPLFIYSEKKKDRNLEKFIGSNREKLLPPTNKKIKTVKYILLVISLLLLAITISRPQNGFLWHESISTGIDIVIAMDTSKSMDAIDVTPNRLSRAKMALLELSSELKGDRIALVPFAGSSFVMTPFTADYTIFDQSILSLDSSTIPKGGTNLKSAISSAEELFKDKNNHKILILVTDGEDLANQGIKEAEKVGAEGIQIFTVGVGTKDGELIPDPKRPGSYLKDKKGNIVKSRLDEKALIKISDLTGGDYRHLSSGGNGILQIYKEKLQELEQEDKSEQRNRIPIDIYRWFLLPAIILLLLEFVIGNIKKNGSKKKFLFSMIFLFSLSGLFATPGDDALKSGDINKAIELYTKERKSPETYYNFGTAYYMSGDYQNAITQYSEGLTKASGELQSRILYNLGNSLYRLSQQDQENQADLLKESLKSYEGSISLGNTDENAEKNRAFVQNILDQMEEEQQDSDEEQESDDSEDSDDQQDSEDSDSQDSEDQQDSEDSNSQDSKDQQDSENSDSQDSEDQQQSDKDQEEEQPTSEMTAEEAEALLQALEGEDVEFKYLLSNDDNSYSGEW